MLSKWQNDLPTGVPNAKIVELPGANLYMFLTDEAMSFASCGSSQHRVTPAVAKH